MEKLSFLVQDNIESPMRLDTYIALQDTTYTRTALKQRLSSLTVDGTPCKLSHKVHTGEHIELCLNELFSTVEPEKLDLDIIYEDDDVCVIDKPSGMLTHPTSYIAKGTLLNGLLYHCNKSALPWDANAFEDSMVQRNYIVHRLDRDTSGVIITAKTDSALQFLLKQFAERYKIATGQITKTSPYPLIKEYIAILHGVPAVLQGEIVTKIVREPGIRKRFVAKELTSEKGRYAKTEYKIIKSILDYSLARFTLVTGRTHQLRVHAKYLKAPIVFDKIYGTKEDATSPLYTLKDSGKLMLHSRMLQIVLPNGKYMRFTAKVPERFKEALSLLKASLQNHS